MKLICKFKLLNGVLFLAFAIIKVLSNKHICYASSFVVRIRLMPAAKNTIPSTPKTINVLMA